MNEKIMHFANFNITYGENDDPMLTHFADIIIPAFTGGYKRGKENSYPVYTIKDVQIKMFQDEYIMVGNYIKDTQYTVHTTMQDGELTVSPAIVPTAPYSRFIILLKNHRMILVRNESASPDIRSFQKTVRAILNEYIRTYNKKSEYKLPYAIVNIVDMKLKEDIKQVLTDIKKINKLKLKFFKLNNDLDTRPISQAVREEMAQLQSKTANITFNSPDSKQGVQHLLEETTSLGLATTTLMATDNNDQPIKIEEDKFSSSKKITYNKDIDPADDENLLSIAKNNESMNYISNSNLSLYNKFKEVIQKYLL